MKKIITILAALMALTSQAGLIEAELLFCRAPESEEISSYHLKGGNADLEMGRALERSSELSIYLTNDVVEILNNINNDEVTYSTHTALALESDEAIECPENETLFTTKVLSIDPDSNRWTAASELTKIAKYEELIVDLALRAALAKNGSLSNKIYEQVREFLKGDHILNPAQKLELLSKVLDSKKFADEEKRLLKEAISENCLSHESSVARCEESLDSLLLQIADKKINLDMKQLSLYRLGLRKEGRVIGDLIARKVLLPITNIATIDVIEFVKESGTTPYLIQLYSQFGAPKFAGDLFLQLLIDSETQALRQYLNFYDDQVLAPLTKEDSLTLISQVVTYFDDGSTDGKSKILKFMTQKGLVLETENIFSLSHTEELETFYEYVLHDPKHIAHFDSAFLRPKKLYCLHYGRKKGSAENSTLLSTIELEIDSDSEEVINATQRRFSFRGQSSQIKAKRNLFSKEKYQLKLFGTLVENITNTAFGGYSLLKTNLNVEAVNNKEDLIASAQLDADTMMTADASSPFFIQILIPKDQQEDSKLLAAHSLTCAPHKESFQSMKEAFALTIEAQRENQKLKNKIKRLPKAIANIFKKKKKDQ